MAQGLKISKLDKKTKEIVFLLYNKNVANDIIDFIATIVGHHCSIILTRMLKLKKRIKRSSSRNTFVFIVLSHCVVSIIYCKWPLLSSLTRANFSNSL